VGRNWPLQVLFPSCLPACLLYLQLAHCTLFRCMFAPAHALQALVPGYRAATEAYWEATAAVGFRLLRLLGLSLGLGAGACAGGCRLKRSLVTAVA